MAPPATTWARPLAHRRAPALMKVHRFAHRGGQSRARAGSPAAGGLGASLGAVMAGRTGCIVAATGRRLRRAVWRRTQAAYARGAIERVYTRAAIGHLTRIRAPTYIATAGRGGASCPARWWGHHRVADLASTQAGAHTSRLSAEAGPVRRRVRAYSARPPTPHTSRAHRRLAHSRGHYRATSAHTFCAPLAWAPACFLAHLCVYTVQ